MNTMLILELALKSTGTLLLAFAIHAVWRGATAAQRCLVWGTAFAVLVLLPVALLLPPRWSLNVGRAAPPPLPVTTMLIEEARSSSEGVTSEAHPAAWQIPQMSATQLALGIWIAGAALVLGWRVLGAWQVRRLRLQSNTLENAHVSALMLRLARESGIRRRIALRESSHVPVPMTWGVLKPVLLLPRRAMTWSDASLEAALRHELGHIRHCDAFTRLLACIVCAAFWPNVLVWLAAKAWRTAQERACDDLVLRAGAVTQDYAMQLLDAARSMKTETFPGAPVMAMARPSTLETRLSAIMDEARDRRPLHGAAWLAGVGAALAALAICAAMQVRAEDKAAQGSDASSVIEISTRVVAQAVNNHGATTISADGKASTVTKSSPIQSAVPGATDKLKIKAGKIIFPRMEFRDAKLEEALDFLRVKSKELDPEKQGMNIILADPASASDGRITLSLTNVPLTDALRYVAQLAGRTLRFEDNATIVLELAPAASSTVTPAARISVKPAAESPLLKRADATLLPTVQFHDATVTECLEFLRLKSEAMRNSAGESLGVAIILKVPKDATLPKITLSLSNTTLSESLRYVAELAGLALHAEAYAFVLEQRH